MARAWTAWNFGLDILDDRGSAPESVHDLVIPGLRRNPKRAHLLVSTVLGKHIAVPAAQVIAAGRRLGAQVAGLDVGEVDVLGMAETATSLGHCVADSLAARVYLHTTRRSAASQWMYAQFQEGHSHATDHSVQPSSPSVFDGRRPLVIVDDEISTGDTALAAITALQQRQHRDRYVVASLVDMRTRAQQQGVQEAANAMGTSVEFVSLSRGRVVLPDGLTERVCALPAPPLDVPGDNAGSVLHVALPWPKDVPEGGRHGFLHTDRTGFEAAAVTTQEHLALHLDPTRPILVVGHEELMYLPLRLADYLTGRGFQAKFQTTTRSPAYVCQEDAYPLRRGWTFRACELGDDAPRFLYNGWPSGPQGVQLVLVMDHHAASGDLHVADVLAEAGYDVIVAQVDAPDAATLATARAGVS